MNWRINHHGSDHIEVTQAFHAIGKMYFANNDFKTIISHYQLSLVICKTHFGPDNLKTTIVTLDLALVQHENKIYGKVLGTYSDAIHTHSVLMLTKIMMKFLAFFSTWA